MIQQFMRKPLLSVIGMNRNVHDLNIIIFAFPIVDKHVSDYIIVIGQSIINGSLIRKKVFPVLLLPKIRRKAKFVKINDLS